MATTELIRDPFIPIDETKNYKPEPGEYIQPWVYGIAPLINDEPLTVQTGSETRKYGEIAAHPEVKSALDWRIHSAFSTELAFRGANDYERFPQFEPIDQKILRHIDDQIAILTYQSFTQTLKTGLRSGLVYGFGAGELNWDDYDPEAAAYWLTSIKFHAPFWYDFHIDEAGELKELWYRGEIRAVGELMAKHIIAPYPYNLYWNYYGTSELQSIYHDVKLLQVMEQMQAKGAKSLMVRPILHFYAATAGRKPEEIEAVRRILLQLDQASVASLPMKTGQSAESEDKMIKYDDIKVLEDRASADGVETIQQIVDYLRKRISRVLGRPDDLGYTSTTVGSQAKATVEAEVAASVHLADQAWVMDVVNRFIIPAIVRYNFPNLPRQYRLPQAYFQALEADWMGKQTDALVKLLDAKVLDPRLDNVKIRESLDLWPTPPEMLTEAPPASALANAYELKAMKEAGFIQPTLADTNEVRSLTGLSPLPPDTVISTPADVAAAPPVPPPVKPAPRPAPPVKS